MIYKSRSESAELLILDSLNKRMSLTEKDKQHYLVLRKGYEGEVLFDSMTEKLECDCLILNDLLLRINHTIFQIDALMITFDTMYLFEVKNYEGDFYYEDDKLYLANKTEVTNPINQLRRSETLLRQLLQSLGDHTPIQGKVIFINPEFTLFQAPLNKPFILPTQVNRFLKRINSNPSKLNRKHRILAEKLTSLHLTESPYQQLPSYSYDDVQKGIICDRCQSFEVFVEGKRCICGDCGGEEKLSEALLRTIEVFKLLFPERKINTNEFYNWCNEVVSKERIRRFLRKNLNMVGIHQWAFFE
ncbi:NERD domain-containing protein [Robertmurraya korlensis]|uniref:nuclease-related domain-containing protein n=1 Tax=Robertmurraya korlensis TaxID=519977 RepID=UPI00203E43B0|nr:nuclease-related domain-containing protein [Robertmurraya korlensis]MCM3599208.1 NERD domain-containing protein [Robertmurraya korlensis]